MILKPLVALVVLSLKEHTHGFTRLGRHTVSASFLSHMILGLRRKKKQFLHFLWEWAVITYMKTNTKKAMPAMMATKYSSILLHLLSGELAKSLLIVFRVCIQMVEPLDYFLSYGVSILHVGINYVDEVF